MAAKSSIEWTEATWNPTTGCDRISAGCDHCYALKLASRLKRMGSDKYQNDGDPRTSGPGFAVTLHPRVLSAPRTWSNPRMIFVDSMSDLFHAKVPLSFVRDVFAVIASTPHHTYQLLTKRARRLSLHADTLEWPTNLWVGVSVENSEQLYRIDHLKRVPASTRFISCEPLLGPLEGLVLSNIDWVIVGGESGSDARPVRAEWIRAIRDEAVRSDVPFFFKQWGGRTAKSGGRTIDGRTWDQYPTDKPTSEST